MTITEARTESRLRSQARRQGLRIVKGWSWYPALGLDPYIQVTVWRVVRANETAMFVDEADCPKPVRSLYTAFTLDELEEYLNS